MKHVVIIPSYGRPEVLHDTVLTVQRQRAAIDGILLAVHREGDVLAETRSLPGVTVVLTRLGLTHQRNDAIAKLPDDADVVTFLDDDVELTQDFMAKAQAFLADHPEVSVVTGYYLKNGDVTRAQAVEMIAQADAQPPEEKFWPKLPFGCNMTVRRELLRHEQFDERLRLSCWLEDADFGKRCERFGQTVRYKGCRFVHLMVNSGRVSGTRMGFSQLMNPYYLSKKGILPLREVMTNHWMPALRNNFIKLLLRDKVVDRWGRLKGNMVALRLALFGRCEPEYVEKIKS